MMSMLNNYMLAVDGSGDYDDSAGCGGDSGVLVAVACLCSGVRACVCVKQWLVAGGGDHGVK